jgi:hypothetical protein
LCLSCRKITLINRRLCFELNNKIVQLSLDCPFWYFLSTGSALSILSVPDEGHSRNVSCALDLISTFLLQLCSQNTTCNTWKMQDKNYYSMHIWNLHISVVLVEPLYKTHFYNAIDWLVFNAIFNNISAISLREQISLLT